MIVLKIIWHTIKKIPTVWLDKLDVTTNWHHHDWFKWK